MISESMRTLFSFLCASTSFDVFGTNNAGELDTCSFQYQYPFLSISILLLWKEFLVVSDLALLC
jgi:hypothetical protein